jgi:hypothetical protein
MKPVRGNLRSSVRDTCKTHDKAYTECVKFLDQGESNEARTYRLDKLWEYAGIPPL